MVSAGPVPLCRGVRCGDGGGASTSEVCRALLVGLSGPGFCVLDGFLGIHHCRKIRSRLETCHSRKELTSGRVGSSSSRSKESSLRTDVSMSVGLGWDDSIDELLMKQEALILAAARDGLPELAGNTVGPLQPAAVQCAAYPRGDTFYVRHIDNPGSDPDDCRRLSMVYYCNTDWKSGDGGHLRLHWVDGASCVSSAAVEAAASVIHVGENARRRRVGVSIDVEPVGDRLVVFWSDHRMPHEVLPSAGMRFAVSTWWADPEQAGNGSNNPLYAQNSIPQRLALKLNEFRPELMTSASEAARQLACGHPARIRALLSHSVCRLSQNFGMEATLTPEELRAGVRTLGSLASPNIRRPLDLGRTVARVTTPNAAVPIVDEVLGILDKLIYSLGHIPRQRGAHSRSVQVGTSKEMDSELRAFSTGGRSIAFLTSPGNLRNGIVTANQMRCARLHAVFFLWGLPGWTAYLGTNTAEKLEVTAGDLLLLPLSNGHTTDASDGTPQQSLVLRRGDGGSGSISTPCSCPKWLEVWFFGKSDLLPSSSAPATTTEGVASVARCAAVDTAAMESVTLRAAAIEAVEREYIAGTSLAADCAPAVLSDVIDSLNTSPSEVMGIDSEPAPLVRTSDMPCRLEGRGFDGDVCCVGVDAASSSMSYRYEQDPRAVTEDATTLVFDLSSISTAAGVSVDAFTMDDMRLDVTAVTVRLELDGVKPLSVSLPRPAVVKAARLSLRRRELRLPLRWLCEQ
eukprot:TRINITY_DN67572_c0_g1_i1.p1 TRINITY_DN67572_c0_g1~~TRINITY_DN67572_c0_g1_i1.p1  ORF type:complete len:741 (-),score=83.90 TRINITY_DN67572_c0_g1_i1:36-2258(-)